jgi:hypothetical protein
LQVEGTDVNGSSIAATRNSADASPSVISLKKSRGATAGSYTVVADDDRVGALAFNGADGSADVQLAGIDAFVDGTPGSNNMPGRLSFLTTPAGSATPVARMTIKSDGNVGIGTAAPAHSLSLLQGSALGWVSSVGNPKQKIEASATDGLEFHTGGTPSVKAVIDSAGKVGIGTAAPAFTLDVNGPIRLDGTSGGVYFGANSPTPTVGSAIHRPAQDNLAFVTKQIERVRIDSSGRLLVGTTSNSENVIAAFQGFQGSSTGQGIIAIKRGSTPGSGSTVGQIRFNGPGTDEECAFVTAAADGAWGTGDYPGRLVFATTSDGSATPVERMRITSNGRAYHTTTAAASAEAFNVFGAAGELKVLGNGNCLNTNNSYTAISDIKLKENIVDASSQWDDIKGLRVVNYNFKPETGAETFKQLGLIAQEVEQVCPSLVGETKDTEWVEIHVLDADGNPVLDEDGNPQVTHEERETGEVTKNVNYSVLYMKAVGALQEALTRIEQLEAKVTALENPSA